MSKSTESEWRKTVYWLLERNGAVEVSRATTAANDEAGPVYRSRLLGYGADGILIEALGAGAAARLVEPGATVSLTIADELQRWRLTCVVKGPEHHRLNEQVSVRAIRFADPVTVQNEQRRAHYRIAVNGRGVEPVIMFPEGKVRAVVIKSGGLVSREPITASLQNISGGGIGVEVPERATEQVAAFSRYLLQIRLPTERNPISVKAELVQLESQYSGKHYLGLRFFFENEQKKKAYEESVCRFTAELQRLWLQANRRPA